VTSATQSWSGCVAVKSRFGRSWSGGGTWCSVGGSLPPAVARGTGGAALTRQARDALAGDVPPCARASSAWARAAVDAASALVDGLDAFPQGGVGQSVRRGLLVPPGVVARARHTAHAGEPGDGVVWLLRIDQPAQRLMTDAYVLRGAVDRLGGRCAGRTASSRNSGGWGGRVLGMWTPS